MKLNQNKNMLIFFPQMQSHFCAEWIYICILEIHHQKLIVNKQTLKKHNFQWDLYIY